MLNNLRAEAWLCETRKGKNYVCIVQSFDQCEPIIRKLLDTDDKIEKMTNLSSIDEVFFSENIRLS